MICRKDRVVDERIPVFVQGDIVYEFGQHGIVKFYPYDADELSLVIHRRVI